MPSPVGHALGGVLFGWMVDGVPGTASGTRQVSAPTTPPEAVSRRPSLRAALSTALRDRRTFAFALLGPLADIDFLFGIHSQQTHSIGAALVVLLLAWAGGRGRHRRPSSLVPRPSGDASRPSSSAVSIGVRGQATGALRFAVACALAYGSHVLLDWMGNDTTPPIGIMAPWPVTDGYYQSQLFVFAAISRRYWLANFWTHNLMAVAREVLILVPLLAALFWWRARSARG